MTKEFITVETSFKLSTEAYIKIVQRVGKQTCGNLGFQDVMAHQIISVLNHTGDPNLEVTDIFVLAEDVPFDDIKIQVKDADGNKIE